MYLRAVVESEDPRIGVGERLKAMELLDRLGAMRHPACRCFGEQVAEMDEAELRTWDDAALSDIVNALDLRGEKAGSDPYGLGGYGILAGQAIRDLYPMATAAIERKVTAAARAIVDAERSETEHG